MSNCNWMYDEDSGRYIVKGARILFPNFEGAEQNYNAAGKRNFRVELPEDMVDEMKSRGVYVRYREGDEQHDDQWLIKIGVYPDADVRLLSGRAMTKIRIDNDDDEMDQASLVDSEFRKGHVKNGEIAMEFHVSRNTRVVGASPYARLDTIIIPIRKSRLLSDYEDGEYEDEPLDY